MAGPQLHPPISVIIPTCNNRALLERFLQPLFASLAKYPGEHEVVVVDNGSSDGTAAWLKGTHPQVLTLESAEPLGFSVACNRGANAASHSLLLFLNSDVEVSPDFLTPLAEALGHPEVFAAGSEVIQAGTAENSGKSESLSAVRFRRGLFEVVTLFDAPAPTGISPVFYLPAACLLVKKERFLDLNGFDPLYSPYSWEDVDLCYRAWKRGWRVVLVPASRVLHYRSSTVGAMFSRSAHLTIGHRNQILMVWKNVRDAGMLAQHLLHLPVHLGASLIRGRFWFLRAVLGALRRLPLALRARGLEREARLTDREVLAVFSHFSAP